CTTTPTSRRWCCSQQTTAYALCTCREFGRVLLRGDVARLFGRGRGVGEGTAGQGTEHPEDGDPAQRGPVLAGLRDELLGACRPAGELGGLAVLGRGHRQPERASHRACRATVGQPASEGAVEHAGGFLVPPEELGGGGEILEVVSAERVEVRPGPALERDVPVALVEGGACLLQLDDAHVGTSAVESTRVERPRAAARPCASGRRSAGQRRRRRARPRR